MSIEDDIRAISAAWDAALVANDATAVARFMADDWVYVGATGTTPKVDIVGWITSGRLVHHSMQMISPARVAVYGDAVVVSARKASTGAWRALPTLPTSGSAKSMSGRVENGSACSARNARRRDEAIASEPAPQSPPASWN